MSNRNNNYEVRVLLHLAFQNHNARLRNAARAQLMLPRYQAAARNQLRRMMAERSVSQFMASNNWSSRFPVPPLTRSNILAAQRLMNMSRK